MTEVDPIQQFFDRDMAALCDGPLSVEPMLAAISAQAVQADQTRSISPEVITALKRSEVMKLAASENLGGSAASILQIGQELAAVSANCVSTAWALWNHLAVFHLFVGSLGPEHQDLLTDVVERGEWVCFPAGAGSGLTGVADGDTIRLNGKCSFSSGGRYADWAGAAFLMVDDQGQRIEPMDIRFTIVPLSTPGVTFDPTWDGSGVRASATDDLHYDNVVVPANRVVPWFGANRAETLRSAPVVAHRYREDWVGLSDVWLGWMGVGLVQAALTEAAEQLRHRRSIMGKKMVVRPTIQVNLGQAAALVSAATATMTTACSQIDRRIAAAQVPDDADYLRQMAQSTSAINQLREAMDLMLRSQGGNGLRESGSFERRWRDFQMMPLHINAHQDRVHHQLGRFILGEDLEPF